MQDGVRGRVNPVLDKLFDILNLGIRKDSDGNRTIKEIYGNIELKGYNLWVLVASALLASIGLDVNSGAVIIGAMLISPLMNPILGVGLGLGINEPTILSKSLINLTIAVVASLGMSVLYFWLTPLGHLTPEIEARTAPTLLDVGVAFFGGIAGIITNSRENPTNAIPGVAIATALMPPVCSAGFGLATGQWWVFGGAFYLFFINAVFISLATYLIVKYLNFDDKEVKAQAFAEMELENANEDLTLENIQKEMEEMASEETKAHRRWTKFMPIVFIIIVLIPSVYFLVRQVQEQREKSELQSFVKNNLEGKFEILKEELTSIAPDTSEDNEQIYSKEYRLYVSTEIPIEDSLEQHLQAELDKRKMISNYKLEVVQVNLTKGELDDINSRITETAFKQEETLHDLEDKVKVLEDYQAQQKQESKMTKLNRGVDSILVEMKNDSLSDLQEGYRKIRGLKIVELDKKQNLYLDLIFENGQLEEISDKEQSGMAETLRILIRTYASKEVEIPIKKVYFYPQEQKAVW